MAKRQGKKKSQSKPSLENEISKKGQLAPEKPGILRRSTRRAVAASCDDVGPNSLKNVDATQVDQIKRTDTRARKRKNGTPNRNSSSKKARLLSPANEKTPLAVGAYPKSSRSRKSHSINENVPVQSDTLPGQATAKMKHLKPKSTKIVDNSFEKVSVKVSSRSLRPRISQAKLKEASSESSVDSCDSSDFEAEKGKLSKRKRSSSRKDVDFDADDTDLDENFSNARRPRALNKKSTKKKSFTKPRLRPVLSNLNVASCDQTTKEEQRLLKIAMQADDSDAKPTAERDLQENSSNAEGTLNSTTPAVEVTERAHLIMDMLKEHEDLKEMSDSDSDLSNCDASSLPPSTNDALRRQDAESGRTPPSSGTAKSEFADCNRDATINKKGKSVKKADTVLPSRSLAAISSEVKGSIHADDSASDQDDGNDWEVVPSSARDSTYKRPEQITVVLQNEDFLPDSKRHSLQKEVMRLINKRRKVLRGLCHQVHLLCLLSYQRRLNAFVLGNESLRARALSWTPTRLPLQNCGLSNAHNSTTIAEIIRFYKDTFELSLVLPHTETHNWSSEKLLIFRLRLLLSKNICSCNIVYLFGLIIFLRAIGVSVRLCLSFRPMSHKPSLLRRKDGEFVEYRSKDNADCSGVMDYFTEVYLPDQKLWRPVDMEAFQVMADPLDFAVHLDQPIIYLVGIDDKGNMIDLSPKYCANWFTRGKKLRPEGSIFEEILATFSCGNDYDGASEEKNELADRKCSQGLPSVISDYKNHEAYALKRHLLKFEAIYPPDAKILGYVRNEPVFSRKCVKLLHSKDVWFRNGKQVREGEKPYKIVTARPKWDRKNDCWIKDQPLEVFGDWQTEPYKPPVAKNGKVPRNKFGNVDLFHPDLLPVGTVHLKLPGLQKIAAELRIDCAVAIVGFDGVGRGLHPIAEGFVVCVEHKKKLEAAWHKRQNEDHKKRRERIRKRAQKNWKKLISKVLWDIHLKKKYNRNDDNVD